MWDHLLKSDLRSSYCYDIIYCAQYNQFRRCILLILIFLVIIIEFDGILHKIWVALSAIAAFWWFFSHYWLFQPNTMWIVRVANGFSWVSFIKWKIHRMHSKFPPINNIFSEKNGYCNKMVKHIIIFIALFIIECLSFHSTYRCRFFNSLLLLFLPRIPFTIQNGTVKHSNKWHK